MKKFLKLCLAVAALTTIFGFASCSNDSSNDATAAAAVGATTKEATVTTKEATVTTKTVTIGTDVFTYKLIDGKAQTSDNVAVANDGKVTVTLANGNKLEISADGNTITYTKGSTVYSGSNSGESISLTNTTNPNDTVSATSTTETKKETIEVTATVTKLAFTDSQLAEKIFKFQVNNNDNGQLEDRFYIFHNGKCYKGHTVDDAKGKITSNTAESSFLVIKAGDKLYKAKEYSRKSGTGLFATWDFGREVGDVTLNANGTCSSAAFTGSFTYNSGYITMSSSAMPNAFTGYYNGTYIYEAFAKNELKFVENYTAN